MEPNLFHLERRQLSIESAEGRCSEWSQWNWLNGPIKSWISDEVREDGQPIKNGDDDDDDEELVLVRLLN